MRFLPALLAAAWGLTAPPALAEPGSTTAATGRAEAEVVVPITAVSLADLSFGAIVLSASGEGSVTVAADGSAPTYANAARAGCSGRTDCAPHPARFGVTGEPDRSYRVTLPGAIVAYGVRTGVGLPVSGLVMRSLNDPGGAGEGRLDNRGRDTFQVGGTLRVPAGTRPDLFRADLSVIVAYN
ncbi:MAG: DUF4402 domain-containing protein [Porphyrobacter sp.]|nr:DUF4402 domain-containing protein [Porphyrobacter sp.]